MGQITSLEPFQEIELEIDKKGTKKICHFSGGNLRPGMKQNIINTVEFCLIYYVKNYLKKLNNEGIVRGVFFVQLQNYVSTKLDKTAWAKLLTLVGISENKLYFSHQQYPEDEFFKILAEALRIDTKPR